MRPMSVGDSTPSVGGMQFGWKAFGFLLALFAGLLLLANFMGGDGMGGGLRGSSGGTVSLGDSTITAQNLYINAPEIVLKSDKIKLPPIEVNVVQNGQTTQQQGGAAQQQQPAVQATVEQPSSSSGAIKALPKPDGVEGGIDMTVPYWYYARSWGLRDAAQQPNTQQYRHADKSQDKESLIILENFFWGKTNGLMVELGALDGDLFSVSKMLENHGGWNALHIEASPREFEKLKKNRPNQLNVHTAVCGKPGMVHWKDASAVSGIPEFMSVDYMKAFHQELLSNGQKNPDAINRLPSIPCLTLGYLLEALHIDHIDAFILDVEGGELQVLKTIDWSKITIDVFSIETEPSAPQFRTPTYVREVREYMESIGYVHVRDDPPGMRNSWYMRKGFKPSRHPSPMNDMGF